MRSHHDLRPTDERPATAGRFAVLLLRARVVALASLALITGAVALLTTELADRGHDRDRAFLAESLGKPQSNATLERAQPQGWTTTVGKRAGFGVTGRGTRLSLTLRGAGTSG